MDIVFRTCSSQTELGVGRMSRKAPECPRAPARTGPVGVDIVRRFSIEVVTPIFGGGPEPMRNDPVTCIRGATLRGQLRFWWRATRGASERDAAALREKEGRIWGAASSPSSVALRVLDVQAGERSQWANYPPDGRGGVKPTPRPNRDVPAYAVFGFQGKAERRDGLHVVTEEPAIVTWTASFTLEITYPKELETDVLSAVWAWVNFGGVGARRRRGCGALYCRDFSPPFRAVLRPLDAKSWYDNALREYGVEIVATPRAWPTLPREVLVGPELRTPIKAWAMAIELLRDFRQGSGVGRNPGHNTARPHQLGRSRWPEADTIRRITQMADPRHERPATAAPDGFPRAEFGLPIVFHFKDRGDPRDSTLGAGLGGGDPGATRLASPLVLKPLAVSPREAVPLVLRLQTPPLNAAYLKVPRRKKQVDRKEKVEILEIGEEQIRSPSLASYPQSPLGGAGGQPPRSAAGSALEAFMHFAAERFAATGRMRR